MSDHERRDSVDAMTLSIAALQGLGKEGTDAANAQALGQAVAELMRPIMGTIAELLKNNAEAMERIAATQSIQNDRMEALEKQIRLNTPITSKQASYINDAIRAKARELLDKRQLADDKKAVTKLSNAIRRDVLSRYGIAGVREIPKHEYSVAMSQIGMWNNILVFNDVVRDARRRAEAGDAEN